MLLTFTLYNCRLNLHPTPTREKRPRTKDNEGPRLKKKKQVAASSSSAAGFIQICDVDPDGRFVQIKNMSDKVCHVNWTYIILCRLKHWEDSRLCMMLKLQEKKLNFVSIANLSFRVELLLLLVSNVK